MLGLMAPNSGMKKVTFPAGKVRQVCVSRPAIQENLKTGKNYPTALVVEDGIPQEYHAVNITGTLRFDATRTDLPAKVFIETDAEFDAFVDPAAEQTYLNLPHKPGMLSRWVANVRWAGRQLVRAFFGLPIISCFTGHRNYE